MFIFTDENSKLGTDLHPSDRSEVLRGYVHRYTGDHKPVWARQPMPSGKPYPLQFRDDEEWLANTRFAVRKNGRLDRRVNRCESTPTFPQNVAI